MSLFSKPSNGKWALVTIVIGLLTSFIIPYLFTRYTWGPDFTGTGQIGDTIGGIAGPILNFAGLLIVYFSLQEQLIANRQQAEHFQKEQQRSTDENVISTAFKIIDDLKAHTQEIKKNELGILANMADGIIKLTIDSFRIPLVFTKHSDKMLRYQPRVSITSVVDDNKEPLALQRPLKEFEKALKNSFDVMIALLEMLRFSIERSSLDAHHQAVIYNIIYVFYEPLVIEALNGTEAFADEAPYLDLIIQSLIVIDKKISAGVEEKLKTEISARNSFIRP